MKFASTRNSKNVVGFKEAVLNCMPEDGGLYVPTQTNDLRRWLYFMDKNTSFQSIAGTLTSAFINTEYSPAVCETIAARAYDYEPKLRKLDKNLYVLELFHGPTGSIKDFGLTYLTACLETILQYENKTAVFLDATSGELGACMAKALRGKKRIKSVLLAPEGKFRGIEQSDMVWNGGNIYPIEVKGSEADCHSLIRKIFSDRQLVDSLGLTVANTSNIGRLLPQTFFYTYAFSRLKSFVNSDIFYAMPAENYGNVVAGLTAWKLALPVNGFIVPATSNLTLDLQGNCLVLDSMVPVEKRESADPADPCNLERLEAFFKDYSVMLKSFVFPARIGKEDTENACKELFVKYNYLADEKTCEAYAASKLRTDIVEADDGCIVLFARDDPSLSAAYIKHTTGEEPLMSAKVSAALEKTIMSRPLIAAEDTGSVKTILKSLSC